MILNNIVKRIIFIELSLDQSTILITFDGGHIFYDLIEGHYTIDDTGISDQTPSDFLDLYQSMPKILTEKDVSMLKLVAGEKLNELPI